MSVDPIIIEGYGPNSTTGTIIRRGYATFIDFRPPTKTFTVDAFVGIVEVDGIIIDITFTVAKIKTPKGKPKTPPRVPVVVPVSVNFAIYAEAFIEIENPIIVEAITSHQIFEPIGVTAEASTPVDTSSIILGTAFADTDSMFNTSANTYNVVDSTIQVEADNYNMVELSTNVLSDTYVTIAETMAITGIASQELNTNLTVMGTKNIDEILLLLDDDLWLMVQAENIIV